jgi:hypothetical protein
LPTIRWSVAMAACVAGNVGINRVQPVRRGVVLLAQGGHLVLGGGQLGLDRSRLGLGAAMVSPTAGRDTATTVPEHTVTTVITGISPAGAAERSELTAAWSGLAAALRQSRWATFLLMPPEGIQTPSAENARFSSYHW